VIIVIGLIAVFENLSVGKVIISRQSSSTVEYQTIMPILYRNQIPVLIVEEGNRIVLDRYTYIDILHPGEALISDNRGGINNNSIVCRLVFGNFSMLFTGDIEETGERAVVNRHSRNATVHSTQGSSPPVQEPPRSQNS